MATATAVVAAVPGRSRRQSTIVSSKATENLIQQRSDEFVVTTPKRKLQKVDQPPAGTFEASTKQRDANVSAPKRPRASPRSASPLLLPGGCKSLREMLGRRVLVRWNEQEARCLSFLLQLLPPANMIVVPLN